MDGFPAHSFFLKGDFMTESSLKQNRVVYFDLLRIAAIYAVVVIHIVSQLWYEAGVTSFDWIVSTAYNSASRWAAPVFVMISGALFLSRDKIDYKVFYRKNVLRLAVALVFWSAVYALARFLLDDHSVKALIMNFAIGEYHIWFIKMMLGVYIALPIIKKLSEDERVLRFTIAVIFTVSSVFSQAVTFLPISEENAEKVFGDFTDVLSFSVYIGYFLLGYYFSKTDIKKNIRVMLYACGAASVVIIFAVTAFMSASRNEVYKLFIEYENIFVAISACAVFVFAKYSKLPEKLSDSKKNTIFKLSKYTFGAYLVHVGVLIVLDKFAALNVNSYTPLLSVPLNSLLVLLISMLASLVLNKIPIVKKYIV